jgi:hypothetical protein
VPVPTVKPVVPFTPEADAVIVTVPPFLPWAIPVERTEAVFGFDDFQLTPARLSPGTAIAEGSRCCELDGSSWCRDSRICGIDRDTDQMSS